MVQLFFSAIFQELSEKFCKFEMSVVFDCFCKCILIVLDFDSFFYHDIQRENLNNNAILHS